MLQQPAVLASIMDSLTSAVAGARAAVDMFGFPVGVPASGGKHSCEYMEVCTE